MNDKTLVERLGWHHEHPVTGQLVLRNPDGPDAATRIEALEIENAELYDREFTVKEERNKAEAKIEALEAALHFYADYHPQPSEGPWGANSKDFGDVARKALESQP